MTVMQTWIIRVVPSSVLMERGYYVPWNEVKQHMHMQSDWGRMQLKRESYQSYTAKPVDEKELEKIFIRHTVRSSEDHRRKRNPPRIL